MSACKQKVTLPELIIAAVCCLQEKNGVSACEVAEYVANKRGCKIEQVQDTIKMILCKAKNKEILCESKGLYRINERYDDLPGRENPKNRGDVDISEDDSDEEENCGPDPCACLKLSRDCLEEDSEEERCPKKKSTCR